MELYVETHEMFTPVEEYKGYMIYSYKPYHDIQYTYWYGEEEHQYISSLSSVEQAKEWIDKEESYNG